eukprot:scaffold6466_cov38-Attheya_sp.AAC.4
MQMNPNGVWMVVMSWASCQNQSLVVWALHQMSHKRWIDATNLHNIRLRSITKSPVFHPVPIPYHPPIVCSVPTYSPSSFPSRAPMSKYLTNYMPNECAEQTTSGETNRLAKFVSNTSSGSCCAEQTTSGETNRFAKFVTNTISGSKPK